MAYTKSEMAAGVRLPNRTFSIAPQVPCYSACQACPGRRIRKMAREPMITARITKNKALLMRVVMSSGCGLGASMAELDANLARRLPAAGGMLESPAAGIGPSQLDALGFVGLRIRLKLADKAFNDLRNLRPHKAEV